MTQTQKNAENYYGALPTHPYHLSVGIIVLDEDSNIICLTYPTLDQYTDVFVLPNKTVKQGETLEETAVRGALDELGATISIITFLGTLVTQDRWFGEIGQESHVEKSVVFFLAKAITSDEAPANDRIAKDGKHIVHRSFNFLIDKIGSQEVKDGMRDFAQAEMLKRAKLWMENNAQME